MPNDQHEQRTSQEGNSRVISALNSLLSLSVSPPDPVEETFKPDEFEAKLKIEYPVVDETVEEAKDWLENTMEHEGDHIKIEVEELKRVTDGN